MLLVRHGWAPTHHSQERSSGYTLSEAIQKAGDAKVECFYAKQVLTALLGFSYSEWETNRWRTEQEVLALVRRAAECAEGRADLPRRRTGPVVSMGPTKRRELPADVAVISKRGGR